MLNLSLAIIALAYFFCGSMAWAQALQDEYNSVKIKTEESRTKAEDFACPAYFPSEWKEAEAQYAQAGLLPLGSEENLKTAIAKFDTAANSYNSLFELTIPLFAQAIEDEIMALRTRMTEGGAKKLFPEYFTSADMAALTAYNQYEAKDYYNSKNTAAKALVMFQTLSSAYDTWLLRQEIIERKFAEFDSENFESGGAILSDAMDEYTAGDFDLATEKTAAAAERFNFVLSRGWVNTVELRAASAGAERQAALDKKSNIAVKDIFSEAEKIYASAKNLYDGKNYEEASKQFFNAESLYLIAGKTTIEKQMKAADAIKRAKARIEEVKKSARQAEIIFQGVSE
ncbi:MAG: hypothetical protein FWH41_03500 [Treponema sp.]|nr:hypothetical protein [Treponema sp.]